METLRAAVIGAGRIGLLHEFDPKRQKPSSHVGMWTNASGVELIGVCDTNAAIKDKLALIDVNIPFYNCVETLFAENLIDVISISTWRDTHFEMLDKAIDAGVKVIVCEKPIGQNLAEAEEIVSKADAKNVHLLINHRRRFDPYLYTLRDQIKAGRVGDLMQVSCFYVYGWLTTGTHLVDTLRLLLQPVAGEVSWVIGLENSKQLFSPEDDPCLDAVLCFQNGLKVNVQALDIKCYDIFDFYLYGTKGMAALTDIGRKISIKSVMESPEHSGFTELTSQLIEEWNSAPRDQFSFMAENAKDCFYGKAKSLSSGYDSIMSMRIIDAVKKSALNDGSKIYL